MRNGVNALSRAILISTKRDIMKKDYRNGVNALSRAILISTRWHN